MALSAIFNVADSAPEMDGVNVTLIVQDWKAVSEPSVVLVAPHVLVSAKSAALAPVNVMAMLLSAVLALLFSVAV